VIDPRLRHQNSTREVSSSAFGWNDPNLFGIAFPPRSELFQEIGCLLGEVSTFVRVLDDVEKLPGPQP
jgi:hypothetical protein